MSGETLAIKDAVDPLIHKPYLEELARLRPGRDRPKRPAGLAAVRRPHRLSATADPGRLGRDAAVGRDAARGRRGRADVAVTPRNLAAHDPCLAGVERAARGWPAGACKRRRVSCARGLARSRRGRRDRRRAAARCANSVNCPTSVLTAIGAAMLFDDDVVAHREAEAGALAGRLGGEERLEDLLLHAAGCRCRCRGCGSRPAVELRGGAQRRFESASASAPCGSRRRSRSRSG